MNLPSFFFWFSLATAITANLMAVVTFTMVPGMGLLVALLFSYGIGALAAECWALSSPRQDGIIPNGAGIYHAFTQSRAAIWSFLKTVLIVSACILFLVLFSPFLLAFLEGNALVSLLAGFLVLALIFVLLALPHALMVPERFSFMKDSDPLFAYTISLCFAFVFVNVVMPRGAQEGTVLFLFCYVASVAILLFPSFLSVMIRAHQRARRDREGQDSVTP